MKHVKDKQASAAERQALAWVVRQNRGSLSMSERASLDTWLVADERHAAAFAYMTELWDATGLLDHLGTLEPRSVASRDRARRRSRPIASSTGAWNWAPLAGAAAVLVVALVFVAVLPSYGRPVFKTRVGEIRHVVLSDQSVLDIGPKTVVRVAYSEHERRIELHGGEVFFAVAHNAARPFVVVSGDREIRALGTRFNVHSGSEGVTVSVLEGAVQLKRTLEWRTSAPTILRAGDQAVYGQTGLKVKARLTRPQDAVSWRQGYLEFHDDTIERVVADLNRFGSGAIVIEDDDIKDYRVTAVIKTGDLAKAAGNLEKVLPIEAVPLAPGQIALRHRPSP